MRPDEFQMEVREVEDMEAPESMVIPIPKQYGGELEFDLDLVMNQDIASPNIQGSTLEAISQLKQMQQENLTTETISPQSIHTGDLTMSSPVRNQDDWSNQAFTGQPEITNTGQLGGQATDLSGWGQSSQGVNLDDFSHMTAGSPTGHAPEQSPLSQGWGQAPADSEDFQRAQRLDQRESERSKLLYEKTVWIDLLDC
jgi:hypothetical protein